MRILSGYGEGKATQPAQRTSLVVQRSAPAQPNLARRDSKVQYASRQGPSRLQRKGGGVDEYGRKSPFAVWRCEMMVPKVERSATARPRPLGPRGGRAGPEAPELDLLNDNQRARHEQDATRRRRRRIKGRRRCPLPPAPHYCLQWLVLGALHPSLRPYTPPATGSPKVRPPPAAAVVTLADDLSLVVAFATPATTSRGRTLHRNR